MKLKKPKQHDYDFYAVVTDGPYANHLVYCDDCDFEGLMVVFICDSNGTWAFTNGYLLIHRKHLLKLPDRMCERNFRQDLVSLPSLSQRQP